MTPGTPPSSPPPQPDALDPAYAADLRDRAAALHAEAATVVADLGISEVLRDIGPADQLGSSLTGLMVWRDIDFTVPSPGLTPNRLWEVLLPLLAHPRLVGMSFRNYSGA